MAEPRGAPRALRQALIAALLGLPASSQPVPLSKVPLGCFNYGYKYVPALTNVTGMPFLKDSATACQQTCQNTPGCGTFAYWVHNQQCWLGGPYARLEPSLTAGAIAGPAYCPQESSACSAIPGPAFPGSTRAESRAAWPLEHQPTNLQCWPRRSNGFPSRCLHQPAMVLEDTINGWSGRCEGLIKITSLPQNESCQLRCMLSPLCAVWAIENVSSRDGSPTCWQGTVGTNCYSGKSAFPAPMRAQRVMHGTFRVLMNTMGMQILNLTQVFDTTGFPNWQDGARKCRLTCLSYLLCQHWQYSDQFGCWIEDVTKKSVSYPLVNHFPDLVTDTKAADSFKAGEYIQHICRPGPASPVPVDLPFGWTSKEGSLLSVGGTPKLPTSMSDARRSYSDVDDSPSSWPWWGSALIAVSVLICVAAMVAAAFLTAMDMTKKGGIRSRGLTTPGAGIGEEPARDSWRTDASGYGHEATSFLPHTRPWLATTYQNLQQQPPPTAPSRVSGSFWG